MLHAVQSSTAQLADLLACCVPPRTGTSCDQRISYTQQFTHPYDTTSEHFQFVQRCISLSCRNELTCGRCGWLWNSDECSGGSHISGISHRVTNSARRVLSIGGVVVLCCCCVCHGGVYEGLLVLQTKKGGVRLTRVSFHHCFFAFSHSMNLNEENKMCRR